MQDRLKAHLESSQIIPPGQSILVGYSGGADSTALLHLLRSLNYDVVAAHLHHGMREEADQELQQCTDFCESLGIPIVTGRADIPGMSEKLKIGIEEAGRHARYTFFRQSAHQTNCQLIATGHTQDDHIETILLNLARGTGLTGLGGIHPNRDGLIRPLLPFTRAETRDYCESNELWYHDDPGNFNENFSRVRVRLKVVPEFKIINSAFADSLTRFSEIARTEDDFLNQIAATNLQPCELPLNGNLEFLTRDIEAAFSTPHLAQLPEVLLARAIRLIAKFFDATPSHDDTLLISNLIATGQNQAVTLSGSKLVIEVNPTQTHFRILVEEEPFRFPLTLPGETESDIFGWRFIAESHPPTDFDRPPNSLDVVLNQDHIQGSLYFRSAQSQDEFIPFGEPQPKKITEILAKAKLTSAARRRLPIIYDMIGPIWIPGVRQSERTRITDDTRKALRIQFEPL